MEIIIIYPVRMLLGFVRRKNEERREWKKEAKTQEILNPVIDFVRIMENREKRR